ncbi:hypothetical protein BGZ98_003373 [Dissophora globulifera]|nr:hypothetical protein BGZ98_003373 [Dissophora globulifera]
MLCKQSSKQGEQLPPYPLLPRAALHTQGLAFGQMEDVYMETPPVSSATESNPFSAAMTKDDIIRSTLGQSIVKDFGVYRDILEEHHERRERIIKVSRDINNFSKKMIFALHRAEPKDFLTQHLSSSEALVDFKDKLDTVLKLFHRAAIDLQGSNYYRYQRSISGAMQEYIEARTLEYYLIHGKLMPKTALEADLVFLTTPEQLSNPELIISVGQTQFAGGGGGGGGGGSGGAGGPRGKFNRDNRKAPYNKDHRDESKRAVNPPLPIPSAATMPDAMETTPITTAATSALTPATHSTPVADLKSLSLEVTDEDYLLGIADLTGELMRLAINALGQSIISLPAQDLYTTGDGSAVLLPTPEERVQHILSFLRDLKSGFDSLALTRASPIFKKMGAFKQSLNKIEMACYNVKVRGAEYPPELLRQMLMSSGQDGSGSGAAGGEAANDDEE